MWVLRNSLAVQLDFKILVFIFHFCLSVLYALIHRQYLIHNYIIYSIPLSACTQSLSFKFGSSTRGSMCSNYHWDHSCLHSPDLFNLFSQPLYFSSFSCSMFLKLLSLSMATSITMTIILFCLFTTVMSSWLAITRNVCKSHRILALFIVQVGYLITERA